MALVYYYAPQSSASPVTWTLEELGIPHERVLVDISAGDQRKAEFLALNPNGKVPLLVHDGVPIFESAAIQMYLGETFGVEKGLYPSPGPARGEAMKWIVWTNVTLGDALGRVGRNQGEWAPAEERNAKAGESARADAEGLLKLRNTHLDGRQYLAGDTLTIADIHLASWLEYLEHFGFDLAHHAKLKDWFDRVCARPARALAP